MAHVALSAQQRTQFGNGPTRRLRRDGLVPGIVYQAGEASLSVAVGARELRRVLAESGRTGVIDLTLDGDRGRPVLLKDLQLDPVRSDVWHVDFQQVDLTQAVEAPVVVTLLSTPIGVREGGVLDHNLREVEVSALPDALPEEITLDVADLAIGASVTVADLVAPEGVTIVSDPEAVVASVVPPSGVEETTEDEGGDEDEPADA